MGAHLRELLLEGVLKSHGVGSELRDTLAQLLSSHGVFVEVEAECGLVVDVGLLVKIEVGGLTGVELFGNRVGGVDEVFEQIWLLLISKYLIRSKTAIEKRSKN